MPLSPVTKFILKRQWLTNWMLPLSRWYMDKMGYRQLGLKYEDLLIEETPIMQLALKRLPPKEAYDRVYRMRRAFQLSLSHQLLPKEEWTKEEDDTPYLSPILEEIEAEIREREELDAMVVQKPKVQKS